MLSLLDALPIYAVGERPAVGAARTHLRVGPGGARLAGARLPLIPGPARGRLSAQQTSTHIEWPGDPAPVGVRRQPPRAPGRAGRRAGRHLRAARRPVGPGGQPAALLRRGPDG